MAAWSPPATDGVVAPAAWSPPESDKPVWTPPASDKASWSPPASDHVLGKDASDIVNHPDSEVITIAKGKDGHEFDAATKADLTSDVMDGFHSSKVGETFKAGDTTYAKVAADKIAHVVDRGPVDTSLSHVVGRSVERSLPGAAEGIAAMGAVQPLLQPLDQFGTAGKVVHGAGTIAAGLLGPIVGPHVLPDSQQQESTAQQQFDASHPIAQAIGGAIAQGPFFRPGLATGSLARKVLTPLVPAAVGGGIQTGVEALNGFQPGSLGRIGIQAGTNALLGRPSALTESILGGQPVPLAEKAEVAGKTGNANEANAKANQLALPGPNPANSPLALPAAPEIKGLPAPADAQAALAPTPRDSRLNPDVQVGITKPEPTNTTPTQANIEKLLGVNETSGIPHQQRQFELDNAFKAVETAQEALESHLKGLDKAVGGQVPIGSEMAMGQVGSLRNAPELPEVKADISQSGAGKVATDLNPDIGKTPAVAAKTEGGSPKNEESPPSQNGSLQGPLPGVRNTTEIGGGVAKAASANKSANNSGQINPALLYHLGAPVVGAVVGSQFGSTPEEKRRNAIMGALIGAGGSLSLGAAQYLKANNPALLDRLQYEAYRFATNPSEEQLNARTNPNKPLNAVQVQSPNGVDVRAASGNGQGVGQQNAQSQEPPGSRKIKPPVPPPAYKIPSDEVRATPEYRQGVIDDINKIYKRTVESRGVDVPVRKGIATEIKLATGLDPDNIKELDPEKLPASALEGLRAKIRGMEFIGRQDVKNRQQLFENEKAGVSAQIGQEPANKIETPTPVNRAGAQYGIGEQIDNWLKDKADKYKAGLGRYWIGHNTSDVVIDHAAGDTNGHSSLFHNFVGRLDADHNIKVDLFKKWSEPIVKVIKDNNLSHSDLEQANIYGLTRTKNGLQHLMDSNLAPESMAIVKGFVDGTRELTPGQKAYYKAVRDVLDNESYQAVAQTAHDVHNVDVAKEKDYWPIQRDYDHYVPPQDHPELGLDAQEGIDQMSSLRKLMDTVQQRQTTKPEEGFTKERIEGGRGAANLGSNAITNHLYDAAHLVANARDLKMLGEIARGPWFNQKYGNLFQSWMMNRLDTIARDGGPAGQVRSNWMEKLASNSAISQLGFRIAQLKHMGNWAFALQHLGIDGFIDGVKESWTPKGDAWIKKNANEVSERFGGENTLMDMANRGGALGKFQKTSFAPERFMDYVTAKGALIGAYKMELKKLGLNPENYADMPVNKEALERALYTNRKIVTSPLIKDAPSAITSGFGSPFGKANSLNKLFYQFQSTMLRQTSNFVHDFVDLGIKKGDVLAASGAALAMLGAMAVDMGVTQGGRTLTHWLAEQSGGRLHDESKDPSLKREAVAEFLKRVPVLGPMVSQFLLFHGDETGLPAIDTLKKGIKGSVTTADQLAQGTPLGNVKVKRALGDTATGLAGVLGVPAGATIGQIYSEHLPSHQGSINPNRPLESILPREHRTQ